MIRDPEAFLNKRSPPMPKANLESLNVMVPDDKEEDFSGPPGCKVKKQGNKKVSTKASSPMNAETLNTSDNGSLEPYRVQFEAGPH